MPAVIALFLRALGWSLVPLGWKLLRGLGFAAVTYTGLSTAMTWAKDFVFSSLVSVPPEWLNMLGLLQIDVCMNIYFSAYIARGVLSGMNSSGSKTSIRWFGNQA
ncbi:DUF2523 domain-containing protein [Azotobacter beijerinckii]|uniref:DUF2523 domain-containing protein n=1 Tax=Azotobacter beijerinckii TaxID=170623 RepID=A0A1I1CQ63_9GAMM|nr:DUF2523 domain-containing protein [Azotobacter beijerinckii]SFB64176.1 Protein of unknown function [Azotobacter beijerinckii]